MDHYTGGGLDVGPNPTDRGKKRKQRLLLVDGRGVPLSIVITGTNRHDVTQVEAVLEAVAIKRQNPPLRRSKHLCANKGYASVATEEIMIKYGYIPHVKGRGEEAKELI